MKEIHDYFNRNPFDLLVVYFAFKCLYWFATGFIKEYYRLIKDDK